MQTRSKSFNCAEKEQQEKERERKAKRAKILALEEKRREQKKKLATRKSLKKLPINATPPCHHPPSNDPIIPMHARKKKNTK